MPDAIVLAGGRPDPALAPGAPNKSFAPLLGRPMVEFVLAALRGASSVRRIALVAPSPVSPAAAAYPDALVAERGSVLENLSAGLGSLPAGGKVLVLGADIPLLTPEMIDDFVQAAGAMDAEIVYAAVRREDVMRLFPRVRKTFVRLRDGALTGGSLILLDPEAYERARPAIERAIRVRKQPWELARLFGARAVLGLLTGTLRIAALERRAEALTGVRARALICSSPEVAMDVDTVEMLAVVQEQLAARRASGEPWPAKRLAGS
ncbi:MAG TPA: NTP transferase domain-containing protein [bacterium]|nr:NTP transferase domain-containing protein [bacterium]